MQEITLILNDEPIYRELVYGGPTEHPVAKQSSDVTIVTIDDGTAMKRPAAVISFQVELPDGTNQRVQAVTTVACLAAVFTGLRGRYGPGGPQAHRYDDNPFIH